MLYIDITDITNAMSLEWGYRISYVNRKYSALKYCTAIVREYVSNLGLGTKHTAD
jgi:hypothetical protein